jgi:hypothetical protein
VTLPTYATPKWWLDTKRGIGMFMVATGHAVPAIAMMVATFFNIDLHLDAAAWAEFGTTVAAWFDLTWTIVGYVLWVIGSIWPTAPLALKDPTKA